jgi:hypothetical protein
MLDAGPRRENDAPMMSVPLTVRFFVATGTAAALVACSSGSDSSSDAKPEPTSPTASTPAPTPSDDAAPGYLDQVNALCDALLPKVIEATHGGSTDIPAKEWVSTWPAHKALLDGFDADLAKIQVPPEAAAPAKVMADYVVWASGYDQKRIAAAQKGEAAWQDELTAESDILDAPELQALAPAGFNDSCQAR